jgi:hypothetical protein
VNDADREAADQELVDGLLESVLSSSLDRLAAQFGREAVDRVLGCVVAQRATRANLVAAPAAAPSRKH